MLRIFTEDDNKERWVVHDCEGGKERGRVPQIKSQIKKGVCLKYIIPCTSLLTTSTDRKGCQQTNMGGGWGYTGK